MRAWSAAAEAKLTALYATTSLSRLAFLLKRTETAVKSRAGVLGLRRGNRVTWTKRMDAKLRKLYPVYTGAEVASSIGLTVAQVYNRAFQLGLRKSEEFHASDRSTRIKRARTDPRMVASQFQKGHVPANKGLRRPGWHAGRMQETQFKKGRPAHEARNYRPIGTEKYDEKRKVIVRKITDDPSIVPVQRWRPVHVLVWQAAHGPVPPGHIVRFRTGMKTLDSAQITLDRLELVTLAENMQRNTYHRYPKEIGLAIQAKAVLTRAINQRTRNQDG